MPAALETFRVHYADGRDSTDVRLDGRALIEAERRWPGVAPDGSDRYRPNEGVYFMVWVALRRPGGDFERWLDEGIILEPVGENPVPTTPVAGLGPSTGSPRKPGSAPARSGTSTPRKSSRSAGPSGIASSA